MSGLVLSLTGDLTSAIISLARRCLDSARLSVKGDGARNAAAGDAGDSIGGFCPRKQIYAARHKKTKENGGGNK
jgi:hypothetical protein